MNKNLDRLRTAVKKAVNDPTLSVDDIVLEIKSTLSCVSISLRAKSEKADKVADYIKDVDFNDTIINFDTFGAAGEVPYIFGGAGQDTISLNTSSLSSDTVTFS